MSRSYIKDLLRSEEFGKKILVQGWVRTRRDSKEFSFIEVNDGTCISNLQVVAQATLGEYATDVLHAHTGAAVEIEGTLIESPAKGQRVEVQATKVKLVGHCSAEDYPLQKKRHTDEY